MTVIALCLAALQFHELKPGTSEYANVVRQASQSLAKGSAIKVGRSLDMVRRSGDWVLVFDRLNLLTSDGRRLEWACLLRRSGTGWKRVRMIMGGVALRTIAKENPQLPSKFFEAPPLRLQ